MALNTKKSLILGIIFLGIIIILSSFTFEVRNSIYNFSYKNLFVFAYISNSMMIIFLIISLLKKPFYNLYLKCAKNYGIKSTQKIIVDSDSDENNDEYIETGRQNRGTTEISMVNKDKTQINKIRRISEKNNMTLYSYKTIETETEEFERTESMLKKDTNTENISVFFDQKETKKIENEEFHSVCIVLMIVYYTSTTLTLNALVSNSIFSVVTFLGLSIFFASFLKIAFLKSKCSLYLIISLLLNLLAFLLTFIFILKNSQDYDRETVSGNIISLFASLMNAILYVLIENYHKEYRESFNFIKLFGFIGLYTFLCIPFFLIIVMLSGYKEFSIPSFEEIRYMMLYAILISCLIEILKIYTLSFVGPMVLTVGVSLISPIMLLLDQIFDDRSFDFYVLLVFIVLSFNLVVAIIMKYKELNSIEEERDKVKNYLSESAPIEEGSKKTINF